LNEVAINKNLADQSLSPNMLTMGTLFFSSIYLYVLSTPNYKLLLYF